MNKEYRIATGWKVFLYIMAPVVTGLGFWLIYLAIDKADGGAGPELLLAGLGLFLIGFMAYSLIDGVKYRLTITEDRIISKGWRKTKELLFSDVREYHKDDNYLHFLPANDKLSKIKVSKYVERQGEIVAWASTRFINADEERVKREQQEILSNAEFGTTDEERARNLKKAQAVAKVLNGAAIVAGLWAFFYPQPYELVMGACLLIPVAAIFVLSFYKGLVSLADKKSAYPSVAAALMFPGFMLTLRAIIDFDILDYSNLWMLFAFSTVILTFTILKAVNQFNLQKGSFWSKAVVVFFAAAYSYGVCVMANCLPDRGTPEHFAAAVLNKRMTSGKSTTYYLEITSWGPVEEEEEISVTSDQYDYAAVGDSIDVYLMQGTLKVPWFFIQVR